MYQSIKNTHIALAAISITLFAVRALWSVMESPRLRRGWVRITPHIVDTLLLAAALYLAIVSDQHPFQQPWLTAKVVALVVYIGLGTLAIKRGPTPRSRGLFALLAIAVFAYIVLVAFTRSPLPLIG